MSGFEIPVVEIFGPVVQGEGPLIGVPTVFIRTGGCDYRCAWCDTLYAVDAKTHGDQWRWLDPSTIVEEVKALTHGFPYWITLSGGNPAIWERLDATIDLLRVHGCKIALETQGTVKPVWAYAVDQVVLSPKPPSSNEPWTDVQTAQLDAWLTDPDVRSIAVKVVVGNDLDALFALQVFDRVREKAPAARLFVQPLNRDVSVPSVVETHVDRYRDLAEMFLARPDLGDVAVLPQLHVLAWGGGRGV